MESCYDIHVLICISADLFITSVRSSATFAISFSNKGKEGDVGHAVVA